ncbi:MAG: PH domain-containing protein [Phycisphaerales bacterium]|nr:PH domain-containing protein [Phycisphaerales bacterium]NNM24753.1 PH domain-containing protein [Phycisphaerales bacterium]
MPDPGLQPDFSWRAHPAREHRGRAVLGVVAVGVFATLSGLLMQSIWWAVAAAMCLLLTLNRFFLPSEFEVDAEGLTARYPLRRQRVRWETLRRFTCGMNGGVLSTRSRPSFLDGSRSVHVLFGRERERVCRIIRERLPEGGTAWAL